VKIRRTFRKVGAWHLWLGVSGAHRQRFRALVNGANLVALFRRYSDLSTDSATLDVAVFSHHRHAPQRHGGTSQVFSTGIMTSESGAPLLIIVWTGMAMSYVWARELTDRVVDAANLGWLSMHGCDAGGFIAGLATVQAGEGPGSLDDLLARAKIQTPDWKAIKVVAPSSGWNRVYFPIDMNGDGIRRISALGLDRAGRVVSFVPGGTGGIPSTTFIRYGHTGEAWEVVGQTIAGAASLGGGWLVWSGFAWSLRRWKSWLKAKRSAHRA
jgi:uncharacterized iron-regulated membrane protein